MQFSKKKNHPCKLLCDSKMKKLSFPQTSFQWTNGFLQKLINISGLFRLDLFVIKRATFYKNFKALHLNLNEQRVSEKKPFSMFFIFFFY